MEEEKANPGTNWEWLVAAPRGMPSKTLEKENPHREQDFEQYLWLSSVSRWRQKSRKMDLHIFMEWLAWLDDQEHGKSKNGGLVTRISVKERRWVDL